MNLKKVPRVKLDAKITDVQTQLLPMLLGSELLFKVPARDCLEGLNLANKSQVLSLLLMTDKIVGNPVSWRLHPSVYETAKNNIALKADLKGVSAPPAVLALVRAFKEQQGAFPRESTRTKVVSLFVAMRSLSKKYPPQWILTLIEVFAREQKKSQHPIFNVEEFTKFLAARKGNKQ